MAPVKVIGTHLRTARKQLGLTQAEVAEKSQITTTYYGKIERGEAKPSIDCLIIICGALHLPLQDALKGADLTESEEGKAPMTDGEFLRFCTFINEIASPRTKEALVVICRQIIDLEE